MTNFKFQMSNFKSMGLHGFTLLEVMIALAVISIALLAVLSAQSQGVSLANESRFNTTASLLAQGKMAEIETVGDVGDLGRGSGDFGEAFPDYVWHLSVADVSPGFAASVSNRLKRIDLEVGFVPDRRYRYQLRLYRFFP